MNETPKSQHHTDLHVDLSEISLSEANLSALASEFYGISVGGPRPGIACVRFHDLTHSVLGTLTKADLCRDSLTEALKGFLKPNEPAEPADPVDPAAPPDLP